MSKSYRRQGDDYEDDEIETARNKAEHLKEKRKKKLEQWDQLERKDDDV